MQNWVLLPSSKAQNDLRVILHVLEKKAWCLHFWRKLRLERSFLVPRRKGEDCVVGCVTRNFSTFVSMV
jgi:hypothetical protein